MCLSAFFWLLIAAFVPSPSALTAPTQPGEAAAAAPDVIVQGLVHSATGQPLAGVTLTLMKGNVVFRATTGVDGSYRLGPVAPGTYTLRVRCSGYLAIRRADVIVAKVPPALNLVLRPIPARSPVSLGKISFYDSSGFETGKLRDPTAGGGYSDSASYEGARMVSQYLGPSSVHAGSSAAGSKDPGEEMLARRDYAQAAAWFRKAVAINPRSAGAQMGLGISYYGQGEYEAAVETLQNAAQLSPNDAAPRLLMAEAARFAPSRQAAVAALLHQFTRAHPNDAEGHYAYAMDLWSIFRVQHSQPVLALARGESEQAVALAPGNAAAHMQLGVIYDRLKMISEAIQQYRDALRANPDFPAAHYRLAQDLIRTGAKSEARAQIQAYEKLEKEGGR